MVVFGDNASGRGMPIFLVWACVLGFFIPCAAKAEDGQVRTFTLEQAIETALANNPRLLAARENQQASRYGVRAARLDLLPRADLEFNYARLDPGTVRRGNVFVEIGRSLVENFGTGDPNDIRPGAYDNNFSTAIQVVQPIYNGGANWAAVGLARARLRGSEHLAQDTRQQVILEVKRRYLRVLQAQELVALAQKSLESSERHLSTSRKMLEVGLRSRTDVLRWEVQRANSEGDLVEAQNNLKLAFAALKQAMGLPFDEEISVTPLEFEPIPLHMPLNEQVGKARSAHPGLRAVEAEVDARRAAVRLAWAAFQPRINFVYRLGWEQNNTLALDSFSFWSAGVSVNFPLFRSFSSLNKLQESKAELRREQERRRETEQEVTLQVIAARLKVETALKKFHIAKKALEQAEENLRVLENTYKVGLAANIDVLDAQVIRTKSEADAIAARYDYWIARAELDRATGGLSEEGR
ncbi:MAG: TolC family protein [Calditrichaeota bacterium]|nr:MAG: TolC family protein [Calditrichota bacterium]